ncbi:hypothetical protein SPHINGO8AM_60096 [Sphingomonas sp. 8AM]|nr:hypothetical protein SPHINGO8AM_60096 [Sphingomonas sp. 8AM]
MAPFKHHRHELLALAVACVAFQIFRGQVFLELPENVAIFPVLACVILAALSCFILLSHSQALLRFVLATYVCLLGIQQRLCDCPALAGDLACKMSQRFCGVPFRDVEHTGPALLRIGPQAPASRMLAIGDAGHAERRSDHAR